MVEDTPVQSRTVEFRDRDGTLVAVMLMDRMEDSLSAVYSFFDGRQTRRSLGSYMILWMIERARALGLPYVYLGYWIEDSEKMSYKARFRPLEALGEDGWTVLPR
jgi:arginine-tRNA-protein transferase